MSTPVAAPLSRAEQVLVALDTRPANLVITYAAVVVVAPDGRSLVEDVSHSGDVLAMVRRAKELVVELDERGERNVGVAILTTVAEPHTSQGWAPAATHRWLVADAAMVRELVVALVRWSVEVAPPRREPSCLERFARGLARGLDADHAAAIAMGRIQ